MSHSTDVDKVKEMFEQVPVSRIKELLKDHDVYSTIEILIKEAERASDDEDDLPVIDLTVSDTIMSSAWSKEKIVPVCVKCRMRTI